MKLERLNNISEVQAIVSSFKRKTSKKQNLDIDKVIDVAIQDLRLKFSLENINIFLLDESHEKLLPYRLVNPKLPEKVIQELYQMPMILSDEPGITLYIMEKKVSIYVPEIKPDMILSSWGRKVVSLTQMKGNLMFPLIIEEVICGLITFPSYEVPLDLGEKEIEDISNYVFYISLALTSIFYSVELHNKNRLIQEKNTKLKNDLKLAKTIQQGLIPSSPPHIKNAQLAFLYKPMEEVGGDFFDFIYFKEKELLGVFISDVSGHGVSAALITSMVRTLVETAGKNRWNPSKLLAYVNEKISGQTGGNFLTAFYGVYHPVTRSFIYARGAHNPPYLIRKNEIIKLEGRGKILGVLENLEFEERQIQLFPGDRILFYTDGLTEAEDSEGKEFEEELPKILNQNSNKTSQEFLDLLYHSLLNHRGDFQFDDDVCLIVMDIL